MDDEYGWKIDADARWMKIYAWMMDDYWWTMMQVALCLDGRAGGQADRQEASEECAVPAATFPCPVLYTIRLRSKCDHMLHPLSVLSCATAL
jgi:hypothetical protein